MKHFNFAAFGLFLLLIVAGVFMLWRLKPELFKQQHARPTVKGDYELQLYSTANDPIYVDYIKIHGCFVSTWTEDSLQITYPVDVVKSIKQIK